MKEIDPAYGTMSQTINEIRNEAEQVDDDEIIEINADRKLYLVTAEENIEKYRENLKKLSKILDEKSKDPNLKNFKNTLKLMETISNTEKKTGNKVM